MPTPPLETPKPSSSKAKIITWVILGAIFIGVPIIFFMTSKDAPVNPNANVVTIDYYRAGVKTSIPADSATYESIKSYIVSAVRDVDSFNGFATTNDDITRAKNGEAIEVAYGSLQNELFSITNALDLDYNRLVFEPTDTFQQTSRIYFAIDDRWTHSTDYSGTWVNSLFNEVRGIVQNINQ
ncbi:MAG: hypothetical protein HZC01_02580 [Candidatus Kerfeldbacteria bacterium]|nr:hypothetical protein [Candidatus Kerfeldbacteria bacterium]